MYSRHPDPRRVWKGGSEQHLLTPLPGAPRAPRAPGANSKKLYVAVFYHVFGTIALPFFGKKLYVAVFYNDFGTIAFPIFGKKLYVAVFYNDLCTFARPIFLLNLEDGRRQSKVPKGTPQVPHRYPRMARRIAKEGQWEPKGV